MTGENPHRKCTLSDLTRWRELTNISSPSSSSRQSGHNKSPKTKNWGNAGKDRSKGKTKGRAKISTSLAKTGETPGVTPPVCGYRSAIAKQHIGVNSTPLGMLPEIKRLVRAIFIDSPPLPRYTKCWDVNQVLKHLETGPSSADLSDRDLSIKTAAFTFILTLSRFDNMIDD